MWKFKSSILEAIRLSFLQTSSSLFPTSLPVSLFFLSGSFLLSQLHSVSSGVNFTHWACLFNNLFIPFLTFLFGFLSFTAILASSDPHPPSLPPFGWSSLRTPAMFLTNLCQFSYNFSLFWAALVFGYLLAYSVFCLSLQHIHCYEGGAVSLACWHESTSTLAYSFS